MSRLLVLQGPGADPTRRGLVTPAPGTPAALDDACRRWGAALGTEVRTVWAEEVDGLCAALERDAPGCDGLVLVAGGAAFEAAALCDAVAATGLPTVDLHLRDLRRAGPGPEDSRLRAAGARVLHGRGVDGYRWALAHLRAQTVHPPLTLRYGDATDHIADLRIPDAARATAQAAIRDPGGLQAATPGVEGLQAATPGAGGPQARHRVAVLVHGGFWYAPWERDLMDGLAVALAADGWATWNLEYRRVGAGGGWPATYDDVCAGIDRLAGLAAPSGLSLEDVVLVGHSAGAQLALLAAARERPAVSPRLVVSLCGVLDLAAAHAEGLGGGAVAALLGDPPAEDVLRVASPRARVPIGTPLVLAHPRGDRLVPAGQSRAFADAARAAGDAVTLLELDGDDHFAPIDPRSKAWGAVAPHLAPRPS